MSSMHGNLLFILPNIIDFVFKGLHVDPMNLNHRVWIIKLFSTYNTTISFILFGTSRYYLSHVLNCLKCLIFVRCCKTCSCAVRVRCDIHHFHLVDVISILGLTHVRFTFITRYRSVILFIKLWNQSIYFQI